jgi:S-adenosylmethionine-diacylgycerolhomoserine-N-methlytransferase
MRPLYLRKTTSHRQKMTNYYHLQSQFYDATRWAFLYGRKRLVEKLAIRPGERVVEIGCGTGANFEAIQTALQNSGELIGVDCSAPMLAKAADRVRRQGWKNVRLLDLEYGPQTVTGGTADVVLFSYSLSMIEDWEEAVSCAGSDLRSGGRIGVLDFCKSESSSRWFADWLAMNHVKAGRPYHQMLQRFFDEQEHICHEAWAGLWSFYLFVGARSATRRRD